MIELELFLPGNYADEHASETTGLKSALSWWSWKRWLMREVLKLEERRMMP